MTGLEHFFDTLSGVVVPLVPVLVCRHVTEESARERLKLDLFHLRGRLERALFHTLMDHVSTLLRDLGLKVIGFPLTHILLLAQAIELILPFLRAQE